MIQRSKQFVVTSQCIHTIQYYTHIYWWWLSTVFTSHMYTVNGRVLYVTSKHLPVYDINKTWNFGCYLRKILAAIILKMDFLFHLSVKKTENISGLLTSVLSVECLSILLLYTVLYTHCTIVYSSIHTLYSLYWWWFDFVGLIFVYIYCFRFCQEHPIKADLTIRKYATGLCSKW